MKQSEWQLAELKGRIHHILMATYQELFPRVALKRALSRAHLQEVELKVLPRLVDSCRESIDVGANVGIYTNALRLITSHVHALESHPRLCQILTGFSRTQVTVRQVAASDKSGSDLLLRVPTNMHKELDGYSAIANKPSFSSDKMIPVTSMVLDEYSDRPIGFVKIDIEGHELQALLGARLLIKAQRPRFLVEAEVRHRIGAPYDVFEFFDTVGYTGFFIDGVKFRACSEFRPEMQDVSLLDASVERARTNYINNFIFIPKEELISSFCALVEKALKVEICG